MKLFFRLFALACLSGGMAFSSCVKDPEDIGGNDGNGNGSGDDNTISGRISENRTLSDRGLDVDYIIDGTLWLEGNALLTIEPGVTIMFTGVDGGIDVGENAGLKMVGTADKPIKFVGPANNPNNGSWHSIVYHSTRLDNQMEYVQLLRGGSGDVSWDAVLRLENGRVSMKNCLVDGSLCNGIELEEGFFSSFDGNTVKNCTAYPVYNYNGVTLLKNFGSNTFTSNGKNYLRVGGGDELTADFTLVDAGIPYFFETSLHVSGNYVFSVQSGTSLLFNNGVDFEVDENTSLVAEGTSANPIIMRGFLNEPGYWGGLYIKSTRSNNRMTNCRIFDCGYEDGWRGACLYFWENSRMDLNDCTFGNSRHYGVAIENVESFRTNVSHSGCQFVDCAEANVYLEESGETMTELP